jgi:catechol 2,3-dioxygenase-like lactoylglutathione lyase family enzyme
MISRIQGVEHIQITVHKMEASLAFYRLLGFTEYRTIRNDSDRYTVLVLIAEPVVLELLQFDESAQPLESPRTITAGLRTLGYRHVALRVGSVQAWCDWATSKGLPFFSRQLTASGAPQVFIRDPDGNLLEFTETQVSSDARS